MNKRRLSVGIGTALVGLCFSFSAAAAPRTHDTLQFRGAVGGGYLGVGTDEWLLDRELSIHGPAGSLELYLGGSPSPGFTIGGYVSGASAVGPTVTIDGRDVGEIDDDYSLNLTTVGPYVDFYFDPNSGFHLLGTVGFARAAISNGDSDTDDDADATGWAFGAGLGYDWWVGDEWSLGVLGRFQLAGVSDDDFDFGGALTTINFSVVYQ